MPTQLQRIAHTNYGLDAPGVVRNFLVGEAAGVVAGVARLFQGWHMPGGWIAVPGAGAAGRGSFTTLGGLMRRGSRVGKLRLHNRLLDGLHLTGHETVLMSAVCTAADSV
jgi:hypothetical protein